MTKHDPVEPVPNDPYLDGYQAGEMPPGRRPTNPYGRDSMKGELWQMGFDEAVAEGVGGNRSK